MNYAQIRKMDISDGKGIRVALYVQYCPFHCKNCYNESTWDKNNGVQYTEHTIGILHKYINRSYIAGLSLLGGDPTSQDEQGLSQLIELCEYTHSINKNVWIWSGYTWEELFLDTELTPIQIKRQELIKNCDVLVDGRYIDEQRDLTLKWRGSKNQRVIDIQKSLKENKVILFED